MCQHTLSMDGTCIFTCCWKNAKRVKGIFNYETLRHSIYDRHSGKQMMNHGYKLIFAKGG